MNFQFIYLVEGRGCTYACIGIGRHSQPSPPESLDGF